MADNNYIPGTCNIGGSELSRRKRLSYILVILSIGISALFFIRAHEDFILLALVFCFWAATAISFLQVANKFCVRYGLTGSFNFGVKGNSGRISNPEFIASDRRKTFLIFIQALLFGSVLSAIIFFLTFLKFNP